MTPPPLQILITSSTYEVFTNGFFALDSSKVRLSFLIKMGAFKAGQIVDAFLPPSGTENNAKFSTAFVLKVFVVFFS